MSNTHNKFSSTRQELEALIESAIKKTGAKKENDLCRYIPVETGGYIHHFTMRKMKHEDPTSLSEMIKKYITNASHPQTVPPKSRAARGSRKRRDQLLFTKEDIERMLNIARMAGDKEMVRKLTPRKDLRQIKKELISSIRHGQIDSDLWNSYVEAASAQSSVGSFVEAIRQAN